MFDGGGNFFWRIGFFDGETELSFEHQLSDWVEKVFDFGCGRVFQPSRHPESSEGNIFEDQEFAWDFEAAAAHRTVGHMDSIRSEEVHQAEGAFASDGIESDGWGLFDCFPCGGKAVVIIDEYVIGSESF